MGLSNAERQERWRAKRNEDIERLRQRVSELGATVLAAKLQPARKPATVETPPDKETARLKETNKELRGKLLEMRQFYEAESGRKGILPFSTYGKLMKCLHPDSKPSDADRREAAALLSQWKQDGDRARR